MKESEKLREESQNEENDFRCLSYGRKIVRAEREESFDEKYKQQLIDKGYILTEGLNGKIEITQTGYGLIDFYPKANRILFRKSNKWIWNGIQWIIKNLLKS